MEKTPAPQKQRSFAPLYRVLIVFPLIIITSSFIVKEVIDAQGLEHPAYFLAGVAMSSAFGWIYVAYEYKRLKKSLPTEKPEQ